MAARPRLPVVTSAQRSFYFDPPAQPSGAEAPAAFSDDLKDVLGILRRRSGVFLLGLLPALLLAAAWLYYATPLFTATATIVLDSRRQIVTDSPEVLGDVDSASSTIDTQVQLIQSNVVLGKALEALGMTAPVDGSQQRQTVLSVVRTHLAVDRVGLTSALQISYTDADAAHAAAVANAIAAAYLEYQSSVKQQATKDANQWLSHHVDELRNRMEAAAAAVDEYRSRAGLLLAKGSTSTEGQVINFDSRLNEAQGELTTARARLNGYTTALKQHGPVEAVNVVSSPMMQHLREQYTSLINQRAQQSSALGPQHPQMKELSRQIVSVQEQMNIEATRTQQELSKEVTVAEDRITSLVTLRDKLRGQLADDNAANIELAQLQTNAESLRQLYESMLTRLQQTTAQETRGQVNAVVVSEAVPPLKPSSPNVTLILAGGGALGLALGAFAVLLAQMFDRTAVNPKSFERLTQLPVLTLVPRMRGRDLKVKRKRVSLSEVVFAKPMSLFTESFRTLRVTILDAIGKGQAAVVQFTSGTFAEGKTVSSIAFAQAAAADGMRVLLIDADMRRRSLTQYLGIKPELGLSELLGGKIPLHQVLVPAAGSNLLHILPLSTHDSGVEDRFSTPNFQLLLQRLRKGFDLIVIDSAPVLAVAEPLSLAKHVDTIVLVTKWSDTRLEVVLKAIEELRRVGGHIAGTILTQVDIKKVMKMSYGRGYYPALTKYYLQ